MIKLTLHGCSAIAAAAATLLCAGPVLADNVPSNTVRLGMYAVFYHSSADDLSGPYVPPGLNIKTQDVQTVYLAYLRRLSEFFDLELAFGLPPNTKTLGRGPAMLGSVPYNGQVISSARWLAPSALIDYKLFDDTHALRPYVGVGVNYTSFYDRQSTAAGDAVAGGPTRISLRPSVGPVGTFGLKYQPKGPWSLVASYSFSRVTTRLTADTAGEIRTTHVNFGPQALVVALGYTF
ncbi:MAG TPA: OmpW family outer membrane protein [Steroidobacteraceae bacterium]